MLVALLFAAGLALSSTVEARHHRHCRNSFSMGFASYPPVYYAPMPYYYAPAPVYYYPAPCPQPVYVAPPAVGFSFGFNFR